MDLVLFRELITNPWILLREVGILLASLGLFSGNVDWSEGWLWGLGGFHATTFTTILITRGRPHIQTAIFCTLALLCFSSEYINQWAAQNYQLFAREQYFDSSGFFIFVVFAAPIIINCLLIVCLWLCEAWRTMGDLGQARVHQQQLRRKRNSSDKKTK